MAKAQEERPSLAAAFGEQGHPIYYAYCAMEWVRNQGLAADGKIILSALQADPLPNEIVLANDMRLGVTRSDGVITLQYQGKKPALPTLQPRHQLEKNQQSMCDVVAHHNFKLYPQANGEWAVCVEFRDGVLGAPEQEEGAKPKYDLYETHIDSLYKFLSHLSSDKNLLVAKPTGSGKTFIQALLFLVASHTEKHLILSVPHGSIDQMTADFKKLLPTSLVEPLEIIRDTDTLPPDGSKDEAKRLILTSHDVLYSPQWLQALVPQGSDKPKREDILIITDEAHHVSKSERHYRTAQVIARRYHTLALTASPDEAMYQDSIVVDSMSYKAQADVGITNLPEVTRVTALARRDIPDAPIHTEGAEKIRQIRARILRRIGSRMFDTNDRPSPAHVAIETMRTDLQVHPTQAPKFEEWPDDDAARFDAFRAMVSAIQAPATQTSLFAVKDSSDVLSLSHRVKSNDSLVETSTQDGLSAETGPDCTDNENGYYHSCADRLARSREDAQSVIAKQLSDTFGIPIEKTDSGFRPWDRQPQDHYEIAWRDYAEQRHINIRHNLLDFYFCHITGLDLITLNQLRQDDFTGLHQKIIDAHTTFLSQCTDIQGYFTRLLTIEYQDEIIQKRGLDNDTAETVAIALNDISEEFQHAVAGHSSPLPCYTQRLVLNSKLDASLSREYNAPFSNHKFSLEHQVIFFLQEAPPEPWLDITPGRPFTGFREGTTMVPFAEAPPAARSGFKALDKVGGEISYTASAPKYLADSVPLHIQRAMAEFSVSLGLADLAGDWHLIAYNELRLTNVVAIGEELPPDILLQCFGRLRCRDKTKQSRFIKAEYPKQIPHFDVRHLLYADDYFTPFFRASRQYRQAFLLEAGNAIAKKIIAAKNPGYTAEALKAEILNFIQKIHALHYFEVEGARDSIQSFIHAIRQGLATEQREVGKLEIPTLVNIAMLGYIGWYKFKVFITRSTARPLSEYSFEKSVILSKFEPKNFAHIGLLGSAVKMLECSLTTTKETSLEPYANLLSSRALCKLLNETIGRLSEQELKYLLKNSDMELPDHVSEKELYKLLKLFKTPNIYAEAYQGLIGEIDVDGNPAPKFITLFMLIVAVTQKLSKMVDDHYESGTNHSDVRERSEAERALASIAFQPDTQRLMRYAALEQARRLDASFLAPLERHCQQASFLNSAMFMLQNLYHTVAWMFWRVTFPSDLAQFIEKERSQSDEARALLEEAKRLGLALRDLQPLSEADLYNTDCPDSCVVRVEKQIMQRDTHIKTHKRILFTGGIMGGLAGGLVATALVIALLLTTGFTSGGLMLGLPIFAWYLIPTMTLTGSVLGFSLSWYRAQTTNHQHPWLPGTTTSLGATLGAMLGLSAGLVVATAMVLTGTVLIPGAFLAMPLTAWFIVPLCTLGGTLAGEAFAWLTSRHVTAWLAGSATQTAVVSLTTGLIVAAAAAGIIALLTLFAPISLPTMFGLPFLSWTAFPTATAGALLTGAWLGRSTTLHYPDPFEDGSSPPPPSCLMSDGDDTMATGDKPDGDAKNRDATEIYLDVDSHDTFDYKT